ncbi:MAG: hypothetical protein M5U14_04130 [Acidimicrobiia bacterium]|nr:hypothetical protein [Acidimicrobiia bacterium]
MADDEERLPAWLRVGGVVLAVVALAWGTWVAIVVGRGGTVPLLGLTIEQGNPALAMLLAVIGLPVLLCLVGAILTLVGGVALIVRDRRRQRG